MFIFFMIFVCLSAFCVEQNSTEDRENWQRLQDSRRGSYEGWQNLVEGCPDLEEECPDLAAVQPIADESSVEPRPTVGVSDDAIMLPEGPQLERDHDTLRIEDRLHRCEEIKAETERQVKAEQEEAANEAQRKNMAPQEEVKNVPLAGKCSVM